MATVLVADDDARMRAMIMATLEAAGHQVAAVGDGPSVLRELESRRPDLLLLDVVMPGLDAFGVLRELRHHDMVGAMRIMLVTARSEERDFVQGWELGAHEYLTTPFDAATLTTKAAELLAADGDELVERARDQLQKAALLDRLEGAVTRARSRRSDV